MPVLKTKLVVIRSCGVVARVNESDFDATLHEVADPTLKYDGPTIEEYVAAGYPPEKYPPQGYAVLPSPGLVMFRAQQQEAAAAATSPDAGDQGSSEAHNPAKPGSSPGPAPTQEPVAADVPPVAEPTPEVVPDPAPTPEPELPPVVIRRSRTKAAEEKGE